MSSRERAHDEIAARRVLVGGVVADKASRQVDAGEPIVVHGPPPRFVSRGGEKLDAALERFEVDVTGAYAVDAGSSTGGFTDCLLQRGAAHVVAIDVGRGQLHERLLRDPRVTSMERTNIRHLDPTTLARPADIVVADLSFISLRVVAGALVAATGPGRPLVLLVKPQFEAGREEANRGRGIITDPAVWARVLHEVVSAFAEVGAHLRGVMVSPLRGADGNAEFLVHLRAASGAGGATDAVEDASLPAEVADAWIAAAVDEACEGGGMVTDEGVE